MNSREVHRLLQNYGYEWVPEAGGKGSHRLYVHEATGDRIMLPWHSRELSKGTERTILKRLGITR